MSWFFSKPIEKYPGKYKLVPEVVEFCLSSELFKEVDAILAEANKDGGMGVAMKDEEFQLQYTDRHTTFVANFEKKLEDFIKKKGSTVEEFYDMCKKAQEMGDDNIDTFITLLTQMLEFQTFMDLCRDPNKRKYLQQVLAQYAKMLTK